MDKRLQGGVVGGNNNRESLQSRLLERISKKPQGIYLPEGEISSDEDEGVDEVEEEELETERMH